jgi:hypothetical protein
MKNSINSVILCLALCLISCSCNGQNVNIPASQDDAVAKIFGDSVARIIAVPSKVNVFTLKKSVANTVEPNKKAKSINGYEVDREIKNVPVAKYAVLQFLMQDSLNYQLDSLTARKCFFEPYLAFEFVKGKETATVVIAFNCECWGVFHNGKLQQQPYLCHRQLVRFAQLLLRDDKYINKLATYLNN